MKILVTGGAGFVGANLAFTLLEKFSGVEVTILDDLSSGDLHNIVDFKGELIEGRVEDEDLIGSLAGKGFNYIFHQAAITDTTVTDRKKMMDVNVGGLRNILRLARKEKAGVVYASSAGVYGNGAVPMKESQKLSPHNLYAESKIKGDELVQHFLREEREIPVSGLRYFNVYGPREIYKNNAASMIWQLSLQVKDGHRPRIFKYGEQARDFIFVKDIVNANLRAMESRVSGIFNVGTGKMTTFNRIIEVLNDVLQTNHQPEYFDNPYGFYQDYTQADTTLAEKKLGFQAQYSIEAGMREYLAG